MASWQQATVTGIHRETPNATTFTLTLPAPSGHLPGQFYVVRLTAEDGYSAQRDYSVASLPGSREIALTVERQEGGEVSEFLNETVELGDLLDVRGPIGGWFAWDGRTPALGVAGGSGVVPLMAMLRSARAGGGAFRLLVSVRTPADLYYADEIAGPETTVVHTREGPGPRPPGRITAADLSPLVGGVQTVFVCGSPGFCDTATDLLQDLGIPADAIRVERFG